MNTAVKRVENILQHEFKIENYVALVREIFSTVQIITPNKFNKEYSNFASHVEGFYHVGQYKTPDGKKIAVFAVQLIQQTYVENSRSTQRSYAKKLIESGNCDAALIAYFTPNDLEKKWRLSFVRLDYEMKIENGKFKTIENLTPAKRYSYLVGNGEPCHTAVERFRIFITDNNSQPTLDELEESFSVEAVTKEFFDLYCEKFYQLVDYLEGNQDFVDESKRCGFTSEQFSKKLMGQIVFLYFLQKKGWLGVGVWKNILMEKEYKNIFFTGGVQGRIIKEYLPKIYIQQQDGSYRLRPVALDQIPDDAEELIANSMPGDRKWGSGSKTFLRTWFEYAKRHKGHFYEKYLEPLFYDTLNKNRGKLGYSTILHCRIPFLSGGLFEPLDGYDWKNCYFDIPDEIFSNKKDENDLTADGILDIFDRYNFTMSEDEPMEREVAIDPEMLGKVFENLLDIKDRKSKGAFYTPREIVHYMCQESLINYLTTNMDISEEAIRSFILYGDFYKDVDTEKTLRVSDPNGKYHMEFDPNRELEISPEIFCPKNGVNRIYEIDELLKKIRVADPAVGSGAFPLGILNEIVRARQNLSAYMATVINAYNTRLMYVNERSAYWLKYETIKNCIFAADIEPSAVDIAKLRLWLALVIDDEINPDAQSPLDGHRNPLPLPNLECNIVCGNSLIDEFEGHRLIPQNSSLGTQEEGKEYSWNQLELDALISKLVDAQNRLFECEDPLKKEQIKLQIEAIKDQMIRTELSTLSPDSLEKYEKSKRLISKPYVLWQIEFARVFKEKGGFDVVIGNPPYGLLNKKQNQNTSIKASAADLKYYKSTALYAPAKGGMINIFRLFVCKAFDILKQGGHLSFIFPMAFMCDLSAYKLREFVLKKNRIDYLEAFPERDNENKRVFRSAKMSVCILGASKVEQSPDIGFPVRISRDKFVDLQSPQTMMCRNDIELIDSASLTIPLMSPEEFEILLKICTGSRRMFEISKCYTGEIDLSLNKKYVRLESTYSRMLRGAQVQKYYITDNISQGDILYLDKESYLQDNSSPKSRHHLNKRIVMQGITGVNERFRLKMALSESGEFCANSVNYLLIDDKDIYYYLGLCNSHLLNWYFAKLSTNSNVNGYEVDNLPIKVIDGIEKEKISKLVKTLLKEPADSETERELNSIVYSIYGLNDAQIHIVEKHYV
ncbi:Eco57I restriction-modification methylase domain-containing protein [Mediterraneibacter glycyrrhizinilyticus]|uniref:Eco57I restriction-modification methylase domain-containing protein n=1 Tax=Mediterraneibacter glycyrrhizinilyticus TaxID=342942 RepID=UPI0025AADC2E|nr:Eco57I restriction-modification methylase domain-containing protein [Mediterraneibacter glycyrrhizinilyticus]MDN0044159.1 Eco57I restriction-modification methylase domain-containing protein [Mediterraneibacter glycyrrhizinilyticus]